MKIKVNENQLRILKEADLEVYQGGEEAHQYSSNESIVKHFYTEIDYSDIDVEGRNFDNEWRFEETKMGVDWSVKFDFSEKGFIYSILINSFKGVLACRPDDDYLKDTSTPLKFLKIDSSENKFHSKVEDYSISTYQVILDRLMINFNTKEIGFSFK